MAFQTIILPISFALAALLGFAAHRASICTVKAVEEVLTTRRAFMLLSFGKTILWIMAITALLLWAVPEARVGRAGWSLSLHGLAGGLIFGVGAVANGGCAFSTLTRLADGRLAMLLALAGFGLGAAGHGVLVSNALAPAATPEPPYLGQAGIWTAVLSGTLLVWAVWEGLRLWRTRPSEQGFGAAILANRYRLSTAAFLMGLCNAVLYALHGSWAYTNTLSLGVREVMGAEVGANPGHWALFLFLIAGMFLSAWQRQHFRLVWRPDLGWTWNLIGGCLMGLGAAMVPGGNDVLLLHGIPTLSPHALPAFGAMLLGIAMTLGLMRLAGGSLETIDCRGDICTR